MTKITFRGYNCILAIGKYKEGNTSVDLIDEEDGCPVAHVTKNIANVPLFANEVLVKNYSENKGIMECLIDAGVLEKPKFEVKSGYVTLFVCKLLKTE